VSNNPAVIEAQIAAMRAARSEMEKQISRAHSNADPRLPWRFYDRPAVDTDGLSEALYQIEAEIIGLERSLRDPEQDAEMRAEINAQIALSGNWDDNASYYMHTPLEEERFQAGIWAQVEAEHRNDMGYDYWAGPCPCCGAAVDEDQICQVDGWDTCYTECYDEACNFAYFLSAVTLAPLKFDRHSDPYFPLPDDED
jgi:hypothetical protein